MDNILRKCIKILYFDQHLTALDDKCRCHVIGITDEYFPRNGAVTFKIMNHYWLLRSFNIDFTRLWRHPSQHWSKASCHWQQRSLNSSSARSRDAHLSLPRGFVILSWRLRLLGDLVNRHLPTIETALFTSWTRCLALLVLLHHWW